MRIRLMLVLAAVLVASGCATSPTAAKGANAQLALGVKAAERGYWQEALFRFRRADAARPQDAQTLNNVAVALEALGRYDEALETYKKALQLAPKNAIIRRNYARFAEFFTSYARGAKPKEETRENR
ncbi:MAG: tetratricopeptide repeat protein [Thermoanaerobaculaceae bacterium]|jgi:Flp pilus assembly protein TadD|nr:tetratricopeptide repeat protein [Thermoanaerobaculaceae bacterium]